MNGLRRRILNHALKNRRNPGYNRRRVGKNLSVLTVFVFFVFLINFAIIIGTGKKFGVNLAEQASQVHQITKIVPAKRGTIYDRNGLPIAEDATSYNVYAVIDKSYKSATGEILYVEESQYDKVADVFNKYLGMDKDYVKKQLSRKKLQQVSFGTQGNGISYSNMNTIRDLCDRCIVLDHGKIVFDGDVEDAVKIYLGSANENFRAIEYVGNEHKHHADRNDLCLQFAGYNGKEDNIFYDDEQILLELTWKNKADIENLCLRVEVSDYRRYPVTAFVVENFYSGKKDETHTAKLKIDISKIVRGGYYTRYVFYSRKNNAAPFETLEVADGLTFRRRKPDKYQNTWQKAWGSIEMNDIEVV